MRKVIVAIVFLFLSFCCRAQSGGNAFDRGIKEIRDNAVPGFRYRYDDYLQYSPAALMVGLKIGSYKGREEWGRMIVSDAFSAAIMASLVNGIKYSVGRLRPDASRHNSFPSGHTATAFMTATMLHKEYGWRSPWWSIGGYTAATVVGVSRILNNRHWATDVAAGAIIGIGSVELGYYLSSLIFRNKGLNPGFKSPVFFYDIKHPRYGVDCFMGWRFAGSSGNALTGLDIEIPVLPRLGAKTRLYASAAYSSQTGVSFSTLAARRLLIGADAMAGCAWRQSSVCAAFSTDVSAAYLFDNTFRVKVFAGYEFNSALGPSPSFHSILLGISTGFSF